MTSDAPLLENVEPQSDPKPAKTKLAKSVTVHVPQQMAAPKNMLQVIGELARDSTVNVEKFKELLAIKREEEALAAEREFNVALAEAQAEMPRVTRDAKSDKHKYVRLETVTKALDPLIAKHNFSLSFGMSDSPIDQHYRITAMLSHKDGHKREYFIDLPADTKGAKGGDNKTQVQGIGSTISYGRRYLTLMIFNVAVTNEDDDGQGGKSEKITADQAAELIQMCAEREISKEQFCKVGKIEEVEDLLASKYETAKNWIEQKPIKETA